MKHTLQAFFDWQPVRLANGPVYAHMVDRKIGLDEILAKPVRSGTKQP